MNLSLTEFLFQQIFHLISMFPLLLHTSILISTVLIGYMQNVSAHQQGANLYYVTVQVCNDEYKVVRVMHNQQPVKLSNLQISSPGTIFFNKGESIENVPSHKVDFKFSAKQAPDITKKDSPSWDV